MGRGEGGKVTADTAIAIPADFHSDRMAVSRSNRHMNIGEQHKCLHECQHTALLGRGFGPRQHQAFSMHRDMNKAFGGRPLLNVQVFKYGRLTGAKVTRDIFEPTGSLLSPIFPRAKSWVVHR